MPARTDRSGGLLPSRDRVLEEVKRLVAEHNAVPRDRLEENTDLKADLGYDSLGVIELAMSLEEHFDITVPDEGSEKARTVGQITDLVMELLRERA